jgi:tripartite-type tricarboxylate transporter receptor subunit TctC
MIAVVDQHVRPGATARAFAALIAALAIGINAAAVDAAERVGAQAAYPAKPIRLIAAQPAGGNTDVVARLYSQHLSDRLGRQIVVDNRGGAGGIIATELVARAEPDGYTLLAVGSSFGANPGLVPKLPYDTRRDFTPLSLLAVGPNFLVVGVAYPARTVKDIIAAARAQPGKLNFASSGVATATHLAGELFKYLANIDMQHVAYKGAAASLVAVASGESDLSFAGTSGALPLIRAGKLRAIAVTTVKRWPNLPDIPTVVESGVPGYEVANWYGVLGPAKMPADIVARLQREIARIAKLESVRERLLADGLEPSEATPKEFDEHLVREIAKWTRLAKAARIGID